MPWSTKTAEAAANSSGVKTQTTEGEREGGSEGGTLLRHGGTDDYEAAAEYGAEILRNSNWLSWRTGERRPPLLTVKNAWRPPQSLTGRLRDMHMQACRLRNVDKTKSGDEMIIITKIGNNFPDGDPVGRSSESLSVPVPISLSQSLFGGKREIS